MCTHDSQWLATQITTNYITCVTIIKKVHTKPIAKLYGYYIQCVCMNAKSLDSRQCHADSQHVRLAAGACIDNTRRSVHRKQSKHSLFNVGETQ